MKSPLLIAFPFLLCFTACAAPAVGPAPLQLLSALKGAEGVSPSDDPDRYVGDDLYKYVNGGADVYHDYDFREVATRTFVFDDNGEEIVVDLYDMGAPANAFGLFTALRPQKGRYPEAGTGCHYADPILGMHKGRFFVQLAGSKPFPDLPERLVRLARRIAAAIPDTTGLPKELGMLPEKDRIAHTERYRKVQVMGHGFLREAWSAKYALPGGEAGITVICLATDAEAQAALEKFASRMKGKSGNEGTFRGNRGDNRYLIRRAGARLVHVEGTNARDLDLLLSRAASALPGK